MPSFRDEIRKLKTMSDKTVAEMTGLEYLERVVDGRIEHPSMALTLNFRLTVVEHGRAVISGEPNDSYCNPNGTIHGSWIAALLDSCMGSAVHSTLGAGTGFTVVDFKIDFVRPVKTDTGPVVAEGNILSVGKKIGRANGVLRDGSGKILAAGATTCLVFGAGFLWAVFDSQQETWHDKIFDTRVVSMR